MTYQKVKLIERAPLSLNQRVEILLVYAHQKPATILYVENQDNYNPHKNIYEHSKRQLKDVLSLLDKINVSYGVGEMEQFETGRMDIDANGYEIQLSYCVERVPISVAQSDDKRDALLAALNNEDDYELGRLFGFPETAILAFHGILSPFMGDLYDGTPHGYFTQFVFSQNFFDEEYRSTSVRWHDTVKRLSPRMCDEIKKFYNDNIITKASLDWR